MTTARRSRAEAMSSDSETKVRVVSAMAQASSMVEAYCRMVRASSEMGVAARVGSAPLAALSVTVSPAAFIPERTPLMPAHPTEAKGMPRAGRQKVTSLLRAKSSPT